MFPMALLLALSAAALSPPDDSLTPYWQKWKTQHAKIYNLKEIEYLRRMMWEKNLRYINLHNLEASLGQHKYTLAMNSFGDLTHDEFLEKMTGRRTSNFTRSGVTFMAPLNIKDLPETVDWRDKGFVTGVKDQGQCGSCWAFSATGSLEGQHFRKSGILISLSEQNLVDCSQNYGNLGCLGGEMDSAFQYIKENNGIDTEESYPYEAQTADCRFKKENVGATCTGYVDIATGREDELQKAVANVGPVSVAIDASHQSFQFYNSGVYDEPNCSISVLDHGVLAVGYGTDQGNDYWLVKNSWGTVWGIQGYIMMSRNKENQCGIATQASYPTV